MMNSTESTPETKATERKASPTPGRWRVVSAASSEGREYPYTIRVDLGTVSHGLMGDYRGDIIAIIGHNPADPLEGMARANADLIAAAPELLDVAKALLALRMPDGGFDLSDLWPAFTAAERALAKVDGAA
jgi:hypothetical protein